MQALDTIDTLLITYQVEEQTEESLIHYLNPLWWTDVMSLVDLNCQRH